MNAAGTFAEGVRERLVLQEGCFREMVNLASKELGQCLSEQPCHMGLHETAC